MMPPGESDTDLDRWRYEIRLDVILAGDGMDQAMHRGAELERLLAEQPDVTNVYKHLPRHRHDLEGAFV
jgi:hypothetical protein